MAAFWKPRVYRLLLFQSAEGLALSLNVLGGRLRTSTIRRDG